MVSVLPGSVLLDSDFTVSFFLHLYRPLDRSEYDGSGSSVAPILVLVSTESTQDYTNFTRV